MKRRFTILFVVATLAIFLCFSFQKKPDVYLFSYFKDKGKDGLHLAYSYDGYIWKALKNDSSFVKPQVSKDKLMRDPCIIQGADGKFHMVWTVSWTARGIGYASSEDLIHWSEQQYIGVMEDDTAVRNCWAPEIIYDSKEEFYMIYWASTIPGRFSEGDSSSESGYNHRIYYTTTKDFKEFSDTKLLYDQGFSVIDAVIKFYDNQYYMFLKDETRFPKPEKNLRIATSAYLTNSYSKAGESISPKDIWVEGPTIEKIGNKYILYFDMYRNHKMGAVQSIDLKTWTDVSEKISFPNGVRHGTIFRVPQKVLDNLLKL